MSTKRPSVSVLSDVIQKYIGSDYDNIVGLAQELSAIQEILTKSDELDAAIAAANAIVLEGTSGFVIEPLLSYPVDYAAEGFAENTLGSMISALALLGKISEAEIDAFQAALIPALSAIGTQYPPLNGNYAPGLTNVELVLNSLQSLFIQSGAIILADLATQTTPYNYSTSPAIVNIPNDGAGVTSDASKAPNNIGSFYDVGLQQLEFSEFKVGDVITLRIDLEVTNTQVDQDIEVLLSIAESTPSARVSSVLTKRLHAINSHRVTGEITFYIHHANVLSNPGHIQFQSADDAVIVVNSFDAFINAKN